MCSNRPRREAAPCVTRCCGSLQGRQPCYMHGNRPSGLLHGCIRAAPAGNSREDNPAVCAAIDLTGSCSYARRAMMAACREDNLPCARQSTPRAATPNALGLTGCSCALHSARAPHPPSRRDWEMHASVGRESCCIPVLPFVFAFRVCMLSRCCGLCGLSVECYKNPYAI